MIPPNIAAGLSIPLPMIRATAPDALALSSLFKASLDPATGGLRGAFFRFVNAAVAGGMSRKDAASAYQAGKFWATEGSVLSRVAPDQPFPRELAAEYHPEGAYAAEYGGFRTRLEARVTNPSTGEIHRYSFYYHDMQPPTLQQIVDAAWPELEMVLEGSPPFDGSEAVAFEDVRWEVVEFGQIV